MHFSPKHYLIDVIISTTTTTLMIFCISFIVQVYNAFVPIDDLPSIIFGTMMISVTLFGLGTIGAVRTLPALPEGYSILIGIALGTLLGNLYYTLHMEGGLPIQARSTPFLFSALCGIAHLHVLTWLYLVKTSRQQALQPSHPSRAVLHYQPT